MIKPRPVDRLEVHILVDNATDSLSSVPSHVETEFAYLNRKGMRILPGKCICCANHGLSCLITAHRGGVTHTVLFDTGPEADTFERNTRQLGIDLSVVDLQNRFREIASARGPVAKSEIVRDLLSRVSPLEAKLLQGFADPGEGASIEITRQIV